jgi:hypothetical protein
MNEQTEVFGNLIEFAKLGKKGSGAIPILREICKDAADAAPPNDLIRMAQLLYDIRIEAARRHIESN